MPVGTQATVKGVLRDIREVVQAPIIFGNTYHLDLRPGVDVVRKAGGLSDFMKWEALFYRQWRISGIQSFQVAKNG